ncbi:MAG: NAD(P)/FAD-dependent oxidoreductase [Thermodesulfobacteriota bacterium]
MIQKTDVLIIGAGIAGTSIARELSKYKLKVVLVEKEPDVGWGQSKASFGICHPGARWPHGSLAQRMMYESHQLWDQLIDDLEIEFHRIGELVLAFNHEEVQHIQTLKTQGEKNGVQGLEILSKQETLQLEPSVNPNVQSALYMPKAGVFSPFELVLAFYENAKANGVDFYLDTMVTEISLDQRGFIVKTNKGNFYTKYVVNAAGLYAQAIARMIEDQSFNILYETKSTCIILDKSLSEKVKHIVTGIADLKIFHRFKTVTPTYHQNLLIYTPLPEPSRGIEDRSVEKRALDLTLKDAEVLVPDIDFKNYIITTFSGLTARNDRGDFIIETSKKQPGFIHVALPPPGITCAPAVGKRVAEILKNAGLALFEKPDFNPHRKRIKRITYCSNREIQNLVKQDSRYGHVICRCETVTEGEIVEAIHRGATTVDGIKFRTRAGMGRCQGGFCTPRVVRILAKEIGLSEEKITKKGHGSRLLLYKSKGLLAAQP